MSEDLHTPNSLQLDQFLLGDSKEIITLAIKEDNRILSEHMIMQARRNLIILSRDLDKAIYDNEPFVQAVSKLARRSKFSQISILVKDVTSAVKNNHRLIDISRKLSSYIKIRKIHDDYSEYNEAFMVADERGVIFRKYADRYEAQACYNDPLLGQKLSKTFTEIWEKSMEDPQLRSLYI